MPCFQVNTWQAENLYTHVEADNEVRFGLLLVQPSKYYLLPRRLVLYLNSLCIHDALLSKLKTAK
jgi:hypothetical protein